MGLVASQCAGLIGGGKDHEHEHTSMEVGGGVEGRDTIRLLESSLKTRKLLTALGVATMVTETEQTKRERGRRMMETWWGRWLKSKQRMQLQWKRMQ